MNTKEAYTKARDQIEALDVVDDPQSISKTEGILKEMSYAPPFLLNIPGFISMTRKDALKALKEIKSTTDDQINSLPVASTHSAEEIRQNTIDMFLKEYTLLQKLRADVPEAWDHINELYEDD